MAGQPGHGIADAICHAPAIPARVAVLLRLELHPLAAMEETFVRIAIGFKDPGRRRSILRRRRDGLRIFWETLTPISVRSLLLAIAQLRCIAVSQCHLNFPLAVV